MPLPGLPCWCRVCSIIVHSVEMKIVFTVTEKQIKERDGAGYDLAKYTPGIDYVVRKAFKGERRMFRKDIFHTTSAPIVLSPDLTALKPERSDILAGIVKYDRQTIELSVVDPSLVEHKQNKAPIIVQVAEPVMQRPSSLDGVVRTARVVKKHANQRWVDTDTLGRVFVGEKGNQIKLQQLIPVRNGSLFLGKVS